MPQLNLVINLSDADLSQPWWLLPSATVGILHLHSSCGCVLHLTVQLQQLVEGLAAQDLQKSLMLHALVKHHAIWGGLG